ncbi:MAG: DUF4173 domain-containing protein [Flavobacteriales bacterium]
MSIPVPPPYHTWRRWVPFLTVVLCAILFDGLFWEYELGLNLFLFSTLVTVALVMRYGWNGLSVAARTALIGSVISASMVVVHDSIVARLGAIVSLTVFTALAHERELRSLIYAVPQVFVNFLMVPIAAWDGAGVLTQGHRAPRTGWRWIRLGLLPIIVGSVFFQLYCVGNPRFDQLTAGFLNGFWEALSDLFSEFLTPHAFFFLFALVACAGLLYRQAPGFLLQLELRWTDLLQRRRAKRPHWLAPRALNPLERERRMGMVLLIIVNALLLVVNVIDISWVWFDFVVPEGFSLKQFVHEGTWTLIASILLSILILLHLFRGNLNFYARTGTLKLLALLWIVQNFILGLSVFLRNYHYISFHGLAYKRIGVIVFLALVLVGLVTLYVKVRQRKSLFYLARVNAWAAFVVLVGLTLVDWDSFIVRTNLNHPNKGEVDIDNYLAMSDKVLPLLYANIDHVEAQMAQHRLNNVRWVEHLDPIEFRDELDAKRARFVERYGKQRWPEWNLADRRTMAALLMVDKVDRSER